MASQQTTITALTAKSKYPEFANHKGRFAFVDTVTKKTNEGDEYLSGVSIKQAKLMEFIKLLGYRSIEINNTRHLVHIDNNIVDPIDVQKIRQHVMYYVSSLNFMVNHLNPFLTDEFHHSLILEKFSAGIERLFNKHLLNTMLYQPNAKFTEHTETEAYFYFINTAVKCTKNGIEPISYKDLPGYIWKGQIIQREYQPTKANEIGMFEKFLDLITGQFGSGYIHQTNADNKKQILCMLGYLLHNFKGGERKMVVLTDDSQREDQGRTGKGLILGDKQSGAMREFLGDTFAWINGKTVEIEKATSFSACGIDTALIHIDDLRKNLTGAKIDLLFPLITAGLETKKLYQDTIHIKPKICASTNKYLKTTSDSVKGRVWIKGVCRYFNAAHSPRDEFKCWFWSDDWSIKEWALFDNCMLKAATYWFKYGFFEAENNNGDHVKTQHFDPDFLEFIEQKTETDQLKHHPSKFSGLAYTELIVREAYNEFLITYKNGRPHYKGFDVKVFRELIESYCDNDTKIMSHNEKNRKIHADLYRKSSGKYIISIVFIA